MINLIISILGLTIMKLYDIMDSKVKGEAIKPSFLDKYIIY